MMHEHLPEGQGVLETEALSSITRGESKRDFPWVEWFMTETEMLIENPPLEIWSEAVRAAGEITFPDA